MSTEDSVFVSAFLCEKVLQEGPTLSAIRIVDTFAPKLPANYDPEKQTAIAPLKLALVVILKSENQEQGVVRIELRNPENKVLSTFGPFGVTLNGAPHGHNIRVEMGLDLMMPAGVYWFNVFWNDRVVQRSPMQLKQPERAGYESETLTKSEGPVGGLGS